MPRWLVLALTLLWLGPAAPALTDEPKLAEQVIPADHAQRMQRGLDLFQREVRGIFVGRCIKCHGGDDIEGELDLSTRELLLQGGSLGPAIVPGKPAESLLMRLITHEEEPEMPQDGAKLSDNAIDAIRRWIDLGAPYAKPLVENEDDPLAWTRRRVDESSRQFWAFQPLRPSKPPEVVMPRAPVAGVKAESPDPAPAVVRESAVVRGSPDPARESWPRTPVDRFVLDQLRRQDLSPNKMADRRTLIRRAYFDLTGLPPSPDEVDAFVNDDAPRAFESLVDRLLDSPHYGERWGRHWLDIARFAESHGFEQDYDRPHAYHYRDFVIRALNDDLPYDQFVRWQIAGDEIEPDNPLAMMATGFLGAGVFPTQLTEKEFEPARYDELDDMVATLGTAMLGLTVGCARCHDHKFDPIPSGDYYRMLATFATTIRGNVELELDPEGTRQALAEWQRDHARLLAARDEVEKTQLPDRFDAWLAAQPKETPRKTDWVILEPVEYRSHHGATLIRQEDGSLLASGENPDFDEYTIVAHTHLAGITSIRLEALAHESLIKGGPGRAANGNIGLGNFILTAEPLDGSSPAQTVKLVNPRVTFEQNSGNLSLAASLDDDPKTGWAVDPQFGKDHAAVFDVQQPLGFASGTKLTFTLQFNVNNKHNIGRPRLAISTVASPVAIDGESESQPLVELLRQLEGDSNPDDEQRATLLGWYRMLDSEWRGLDQRVADHLKAKPQPKTTTVMVTSEGVKPIPHHADGRGFPHFYQETYFLHRGDTEQKQGVSSPGYLQILTSRSLPSGEGTWADEFDAAAAFWQADPPEDSPTSYRRRALADWMTDTEHGAGHLLARVIVNRLWQHHFGRGIVATANDFGYQGQRPTHPELLDWLAAQLIEGGWRLKPLHRLMMTSAVYMQSGEFNEAASRVDPDNRYLWRFAPRRLEAEVIRDAMLAVGGEWDPTMFGPGSLDSNMKRRSIYFMIKRSSLVPMLQIFDAPEPLVSVGNRPATTIAPQALHFMNNEQVRASARGLARRLGGDDSPAERTRRAYLAVLAREPSTEESGQAIAFLASQADSYASDGKQSADELALTDFCQILFGLNEFIYID